MKNGYDQFFRTARKISVTADRGGGAKEFLAPPIGKRSDLLKSEVESLLRKNVVMKKLKKRPRSWPSVFLSMIGFCLAMWGFINREKVESILQNVEVSMTGAAQAELKPSEIKPQGSAEKRSPSSEASESSAVEKKPENSQVEAGEVSHLQKLAQRKRQLDDREAELARVEDEIGKQKVEIEKRMRELEEMRSKISAILEDRVKIDEQKVDSLMQMYSNMKPPQAAKIFETMDEDLAVEIMGRMKKKNAAEILNLLKPEKAQVISEKYAGYRRKPAATNGEKQ